MINALERRRTINQKVLSSMVDQYQSFLLFAFSSSIVSSVSFDIISRGH